jgi:hypothetical protein
VKIPTAKARLDELAAHNADEEVHIVVWRHEQRKKREETDRTRFQMDLPTHEMYVEMHAEKDRLVRICGNPVIAKQLMLDAWKALKDEAILRWLASQEGPS